MLGPLTLALMASGMKNHNDVQVYDDTKEKPEKKELTEDQKFAQKRIHTNLKHGGT